MEREVEPRPEPAREPFDPHMGPLDDPEDARYLDPADPRRLAVERDRGAPFNGEEEDTGLGHRIRERRRHRHDEEED